MKALKGMIRLVRPANALICAVSVICGGIIRGRPFTEAGKFLSCGFGSGQASTGNEAILLSAALSAALILAAGNIFNDVCDRDCDIVNAPHRPIPSGAVTPKAASVFALILAAIGMAFSVPLGARGAVVAAFAVALLAAYDLKLKRIPLAGNLAVSLLGGLAFVYGGIAGGSVERALIPATFAVLFHFGRELIKDAADIRGDRAAGMHTAATAWGIDTTCRISAVALMTLAVLTVGPFTFGLFGIGYFMAVMLGVWPILLYASIAPLRNPSERILRRTSFLLKADMPVGIIVVLAGFQGL